MIPGLTSFEEGLEHRYLDTTITSTGKSNNFILHFNYILTDFKNSNI